MDETKNEIIEHETQVKVLNPSKAGAAAYQGLAGRNRNPWLSSPRRRGDVGVQHEPQTVV
jgi:hypothetical protein